jgi:trans-aconitate 2-methyltransferase
MAVSSWSPTHYLQFEDERTRPPRDLLARVPLVEAKRVVDIGCGPANSTELLAQRFPDADVAGVDSSAEMLVEARKRMPQASFVEADIAQWAPQEPVDLLFANAVFQWVPDHLSILVRLLENLAPGGVLAIQVPDNFSEPSHRLMRDVALAGPWRNRLESAKASRDRIPPPATYYDRLKPLASNVDIWHTLYNHPLDGPDAIADMFASTGLRPYLALLAEDEREAYLGEYRRLVAEAYPPLVDGRVLLRFPRLFVVAVRG